MALTITPGLVTHVSNTMLEETIAIAITDDVTNEQSVKYDDVTISAPDIYKIYKTQVNDHEINIKIYIPITGIVEIGVVTDDYTDNLELSYIVEPSYTYDPDVPYTSIIGPSLYTLIDGEAYIEPGAIAYYENEDISDQIEITNPEPAASGTSVITYKVMNSDGIYSNTTTRTVIVKKDKNILLAPEANITITDVEIKHALPETPLRTYGIPFNIGRTI